MHASATKWIREFKDKTQGKKLAVGDTKAVLARVLGAVETIWLIREAGEGHLEYVEETRQDGAGFDPFRNSLWKVLRQAYPSRPDLNCLQGEQVGETEHPMVYYQKINKEKAAGNR